MARPRIDDDTLDAIERIAQQVTADDTDAASLSVDKQLRAVAHDYLDLYQKCRQAERERDRLQRALDATADATRRTDDVPTVAGDKPGYADKGGDASPGKRAPRSQGDSDSTVDELLDGVHTR